MNRVTLLEKDALQLLLQGLPEKLWIHYYPVILSNNAVHVDSVCDSTVLLIKENDTWDLFMQPLGDHSNGTLERIFNYLRELNGNNNGSILNCTTSFVRGLDPELYDVRPDCWDYIYDTKEQATLCGKKFGEIRNHINYFKKHYQYTVSAYTPDDYEQCDRLFNGWKARKQVSTQVRDEYIAQLFQNLCLFPDMFGVVVRVDERVVGFSIGGLLAPDEAICIIRKTDYQYKGLSEFIDHYFYRCIPENVRVVNDGDDLNSESLRKYKMKWNPAGLRNYYTVQQKN